MTPEELLTPRYKVIADWPFNDKFKIGEILVLFKTGEGKDAEYYYHHPTTHQNFEDCWFDCFPHLFSKLQWWKERKAEDMPDYFRIRPDEWNEGKIVCKVSDVGKWEFHESNGYIFKYNSGAGTLSSYLLPATESEYNEYLNQTP